MSNVRVFSLARDLKLSSQEVIDRLHKLGMEVKTASSSVDEDTADKLRRALKIDALTAKRKRVYGSDEDESERDRLEREQQERVAAERAAREAAAEEARLAAEAQEGRQGTAQAGTGEGARRRDCGGARPRPRRPASGAEVGDAGPGADRGSGRGRGRVRVCRRRAGRRRTRGARAGSGTARADAGVPRRRVLPASRARP